MSVCLPLSLSACLFVDAGASRLEEMATNVNKKQKNEPKPYTGASRLEETATNVDACIMCCPLNLHTKGLLGAQVSVLVCVLMCALVCDLICVLICAHICALVFSLYGSLYVPFCVSHVHVCPYVCPCMHYVAFSMVRQHTHKHTQTHTHQVMGAMPKGALIVNVARGGIDRMHIGYPTPLYHWSLYNPLPNYSTGDAGVVEREALVSLLTQRHLGGVAMDVFWKGALFVFYYKFFYYQFSVLLLLLFQLG